MNTSKKLIPLNIRCNRIKDNAFTHIYIVDFNKKPQEDTSSSYKSFFIDYKSHNVQDFVNSILQDCNKKNILIYSCWASADYINKVLSSLPKHYDYQNITIINFSYVFESNMVYIPQNLKIRKITNVFSNAQPFMTNKVFYNKTYIGVNNNNNIFHYRIMKHTHIQYNNIKESWWFKWYFSVPICASGRLQQITGTCWFNATLNSLLLTPFIAEVLKESFEKLDDEIKNKIVKSNFDACIDKKQNLHRYLYTIVYLVLLKEERAMYSYGNIVKQAAITLKQENDEECYNSEIAMIEMLKTFFDKDTTYVCLEYNKTWLQNLKTLQQSKQNIDFIVLLKCPQSKSGSSIFIDDDVYVLESGIIGIQNKESTEGHVVTGLKCDDLWYIYDSNNNIYECKWFLDDCNKFLNQQYNTLQYSFPYYPVLIYIKDVLTRNEYEQVLQSEIQIVQSFANTSNTKIQYFEELRHKLGFYTDHLLYKLIQNKIKLIRIEAIENVKQLLTFKNQDSMDTVIKGFKALNISLSDTTIFTDHDIYIINTLNILNIYFKEFEKQGRVNNIKYYLNEYINIKRELESINFTNAIEYDIINNRIDSLTKMNEEKYVYFIITDKSMLPVTSDTIIQGGSNSKYIRTNEKIELGKNIVRNIYILKNDKRKKYVKYRGSFLTINQVKKAINMK